ncbi:MAG: hypothetical protein M3362_25865 [Acidobacteriota bacterium]|nr:hypothetical protein [Acidobacteriota bacterium]
MSKREVDRKPTAYKGPGPLRAQLTCAVSCGDVCGGRGVRICDPHGAYASCEIFGACAFGASGACVWRAGRVFWRVACAFLRVFEAFGGEVFCDDDVEGWRPKRASG